MNQCVSQIPKAWGNNTSTVHNCKTLGVILSLPGSRCPVCKISTESELIEDMPTYKLIGHSITDGKETVTLEELGLANS